MIDQKKTADKMLEFLPGRTRELDCLYNIGEIFREQGESLDKIYVTIVQLVPDGWRYPDICHTKIIFNMNPLSHIQKAL